MEMCHIAPTQYLRPLNIDNYKTHLLLAHLVEEDEEYTKFYADTKYRAGQYGVQSSQNTYILDNSAFELYRRNQPMFDGNKLLDLGRKVRADYIVMPDYPAEPGSKTIKSAQEFAPQFKEKGFGTFFVPQSRIGDVEDYIATFAWAASSPLVDYIGMSILGIPNAFGVDDNDIQRTLSRTHMFNILRNRGLLQLAKTLGKKIHCLGMMDGPREIDLLSDFIYLKWIDSWDSSAAVWAGISDVGFDNSPTGLVNGKVKTHVDFNIAFDEGKLPLITRNIKFIDDLITRWEPVKA
jgi:hypothetical protein